MALEVTRRECEYLVASDEWVSVEADVANGVIVNARIAVGDKVFRVSAVNLPKIHNALTELLMEIKAAQERTRPKEEPDGRSGTEAG